MKAVECRSRDIGNDECRAVKAWQAMRAEIRMPTASPGMEEGTIISWLKTVGDAVDRGESLVQIATDKATLEIESRATGTLVEIVYANGAEVPVGAVIGFIELTENAPT
jgi:pyruvate/2-oxoglutarate dehydrogenase complex dihydrolipoamide acyltransferase (E2) component